MYDAIKLYMTFYPYSFPWKVDLWKVKSVDLWDIFRIFLQEEYMYSNLWTWLNNFILHSARFGVEYMHICKFNLWNPSSKDTAKVKNHIKTFAHSKCGLLNARLINNKEDSIYELITDIDVLALTETWWTDNSDVSLGLVTPPGYSSNP